MKTIYLDKDYMCHVNNSDGMLEIKTDIFDSFCDGAIECYRFVPSGEKWQRLDGKIIHGQFIQPVTPVTIPDAVQTQYNRDEAAYMEELAALIEEIYNEDMEVIG